MGPNLFRNIVFGVWCYLKTFILSYQILRSSLWTNSPPNLISTLILFFTISLYLIQPYLLTKTKLLPFTQTYLLTKSKTEQLTQPLYNTTLNHTPNKLLHWTTQNMTLNVIRIKGSFHSVVFAFAPSTIKFGASSADATFIFTRS